MVKVPVGRVTIALAAEEEAEAGRVVQGLAFLALACWRAGVLNKALLWLPVAG